MEKYIKHRKIVISTKSVILIGMLRFSFAKFLFLFGSNTLVNVCVKIYLTTVAALCNAHAFESAHPQSYVIAHKLLICRFEVNCLHINPIIGEI